MKVGHTGSPALSRPAAGRGAVCELCWGRRRRRGRSDAEQMVVHHATEPPAGRQGAHATDEQERLAVCDFHPMTLVDWQCSSVRLGQLGALTRAENEQSATDRDRLKEKLEVGLLRVPASQISRLLSGGSCAEGRGVEW